MGLKPRLFISNQLRLSSGMDNDAIEKSVGMILKDDPMAGAPNGSPLISPAAKPTNEPLRSPAVGDLQPLRVDVNGHKQPSSTLVSPISSSLVSTALPTPLIDFESNSNCSDSSFPKGDLYPPGTSKGATDFGGFAAPKASPGFALRSPPAYAHLGPSTSGANIARLPSQKPPNLVASSQLTAQRRNGDIIRRNLVEKVARQKPHLRFMLPRYNDLNANTLSSMLKKGKKQIPIPREIDNFLFDENIPEQLKVNQRVKTNRLEDPDQTEDDSDFEPETKNHKKQRVAEKQLAINSDYARICLSIDEKSMKLDKFVKDYKIRYSEEDKVCEENDSGAARFLTYKRKNNRQCVRLPKSFDMPDPQLAPSTSRGNTDHILRSKLSGECAILKSTHISSCVPAFTIRKTLSRAPQLLDLRDLEEENVRNGTARRMEREKRRIREEERKNSRLSSDYEDTDDDADYCPEPKDALTKKKRRRGRPSRLEKHDEHGPSKIGRKNTLINKHAPLYEGELCLDLTQVALSDEKPKYAQIQIPAFSNISDESLLKSSSEPLVAKVSCAHSFPDLLSQHEQHHPILEKEEKTRYLNPSKKPRNSVDKESSGDKTPLPSPVSFIKPTA